MTLMMDGSDVIASFLKLFRNNLNRVKNRKLIEFMK